MTGPDQTLDLLSQSVLRGHWEDIKTARLLSQVEEEADHLKIGHLYYLAMTSLPPFCLPGSLTPDL